MKYLCLVYVEERALDGLPKSEYDALVNESLAYDEELRKRGHYVSSETLQPIRAATTLRTRRGRLSVTDGPFAETNEQLGGFILIDARDLNQAIHLAAKIPVGRFGAIEVRPILELTPQ